MHFLNLFINLFKGKYINSQLNMIASQHNSRAQSHRTAGKQQADNIVTIALNYQ